MNKQTLIIGILIAAGIIGLAYTTKQKNTSSSTNQGINLSDTMSPEQEISHGHGLAVDVADPNKLYVATHHGLLLLLNDKDLYRLGKSKDDYMGFSPHPTDAKVFFSSGHPETGGNVGFQKSEDGGITWKKISDGVGGPVDFHAMAVSPVNPDLVFGWYRGDVQRSTDGGRNWTKFATPFPFVALTGDTVNENIVYASSLQGLFKSINKGQSWDQLFDGFVSAVTVHPNDSKILVISSEKQGFAKSTDSGKTWQKINQNVGDETVLFIAYDSQNPDVLYLLTQKNNLYKSHDGGHTWNKIR